VKYPKFYLSKNYSDIDEAADREADKVKDEMNKLAEAGALIGLGAVELSFNYS
jgi:hypothetical protein